MFRTQQKREFRGQCRLEYPARPCKGRLTSPCGTRADHDECPSLMQWVTRRNMTVGGSGDYLRRGSPTPVTPAERDGPICWRDAAELEIQGAPGGRWVSHFGGGDAIGRRLFACVQRGTRRSGSCRGTDRGTEKCSVFAPCGVSRPRIWTSFLPYCRPKARLEPTDPLLSPLVLHLFLNNL